MKHFNTLKLSLFIIFGMLFTITTKADTYTINSGSYYYSPSSLTINVGDTVKWYNDGGFHNVNANFNSITGTSYNNPESFVSSATGSVGALIYTHVFTIPGTYNYDCSIGNHAANGMVGTINVLEANTDGVHNIYAGNYYYSPSVLTINVGETVNWYNNGGFHNVNADVNSITGESFYNPEAFVSSATGTVGALIYSHVFNTPGIYTYDCSIGNHAANGMVGTIIVEMTNEIQTPDNPVDVTFRVNMQNENVNLSGVYMAGGPWQVTANSALGFTAAGISGGTPTGIAMSDPDADGIWEVTIPLEENTFFYWKFRNGYFQDWAAIEGAWEPNFNGLGCGFWDNGDRRILVNSDNTVYEFCFSSCDEVCPEPPVNVTLSLNSNDYPSCVVIKSSKLVIT